MDRTSQLKMVLRNRTALSGFAQRLAFTDAILQSRCLNTMRFTVLDSIVQSPPASFWTHPSSLKSGLLQAGGSKLIITRIQKRVKPVAVPSVDITGTQERVILDAAVHWTGDGAGSVAVVPAPKQNASLLCLPFDKFTFHLTNLPSSLIIMLSFPRGGGRVTHQPPSFSVSCIMRWLCFPTIHSAR